MHLQRLSNGEHGPENLRRCPCFLHSVCVKFARKQNGCLLSADILRRTPMLCALWVLLSMLCRSGGNGAKFHQDARSDPREIHRRAPAPIFWEVPRRAAEMAANTPKKFTWMPGKTLLKSPKNLKKSGVSSGLCLPCENLRGAFGNGAAEQFPAGCFLTSSNILPALSDHAAQRSGKKHTPQKWVPGHLCLYCSCRCAAN